MNSINTAPKIPLAKISRYQVEAEIEKRNRAIENLNQAQKPVRAPPLEFSFQSNEHFFFQKPPKPVPVEENLSELNRAMFDTHIATNIDEALVVLNAKDDAESDKHPEKRMKAAYKAYETAQLVLMKADNPNLKLSQLKQIIFKNWQKSPENPMNQ